MKLIQRLGSDITDEYINSYIEHIKKHKGSCDEVWLATQYGFPSLKKHEESMKKLKSAAEKFRSAGITVSLQLSNSIGHGQYMSSRDCSGLVYNGSPVEKMVGHDGTVADYCFCWRGKNFENYLLRELEIYAQIQPECIWVDDDFRASNHAPVTFGCFCDNCISKFNEEYSYNFDRKNLVKEFIYGDIKVREDYIKFMRAGLGELMYKMGSAVHKISPDTAFGLQYAAHGAYTGYGYEFIFGAMKKSTGHTPKSRPGGGAYNDHDPNIFLDKAVFMNWANSMLPDYVECKCPEIENLPFAVFGKSPAGTAFETSYYFANGNTDMSYSMIMNLNEPMEWHDEEFRLFSAHRKYWERLSEYNRKTHQSGLNYFMSKNIWRKKLSENDTMNDLNNEHYSGADLWLRDAIPISFDRCDRDVILLHPETAKYLSDEEIEYLLEKNVVTDGETVEILKEKGINLGIDAKKISDADILKIKEKLTNHTVNPEDFSHWSSSFFTEGRNNAYYFTQDGANPEIIGTYCMSNTTARTDDPSISGGIAEMILKTQSGDAWCVLGYAPWKGVISLKKRNQILNIADYISGNSLPARLNTPFKAVLLPRKNNCGKTAAVSIANCTVGKSGTLELLVRNPASENFVFMSQTCDEMNIEYKKIGSEYILSIPPIDAWSVGTVFCE